MGRAPPAEHSVDEAGAALCCEVTRFRSAGVPRTRGRLGGEMSAPRKRVWAAVVLGALLAGSIGSGWRLSAQSGTRSGAQAVSGRMPRPAVTSGERGTTYDWLESKATKVTTRFADATVVAERAADG